MYLSNPAQTLKDQGDGAGTQPATRSSGGDLSENSGHNHEDVLEPPLSEGRADQATMEVVSGGAEQSGNEDEQVVGDDTLSQRSEPTSQDDRNITLYETETSFWVKLLADCSCASNPSFYPPPAFD